MTDKGMEEPPKILLTHFKSASFHILLVTCCWHKAESHDLIKITFENTSRASHFTTPLWLVSSSRGGLNLPSFLPASSFSFSVDSEVTKLSVISMDHMHTVVSGDQSMHILITTEICLEDHQVTLKYLLTAIRPWSLLSTSTS